MKQYSLYVGTVFKFYTKYFMREKIKNVNLTVDLAPSRASACLEMLNNRLFLDCLVSRVGRQVFSASVLKVKISVLSWS